MSARPDIWTPIVNRGRAEPLTERRYRETGMPAAIRRGLEPGTRRFEEDMGRCTILVGRHPTSKMWHLSIANSEHYPTWDDIADARYKLIPDDVMMVMILPPRSEYVNVHEYCFHLHEVPEAAEAAR